MAEIQAFGALRFSPDAGNMEELACPPYDIISEKEREEYLARNDKNIIRLELPREGADPYARAGETLREWLADGTLCQDEEGLYVYEEEFTVQGQRKTVRGLTCRVRLEEWEKGVVLPHEETLSKAKQDRFDLMRATGCNFSSIYSLYFDEDNTTYPLVESGSAGTPDLEFTTADGITHRVWAIRDPMMIQELCGKFTGKKLYIADGHHRYETAIRYRDYLKEQGQITGPDHPANFVMMTLVHMEHPGLVVFPTHRIVRDLPNPDLPKLLEDMEEFFEIQAAAPAAIAALLAGAAHGGQKAVGLYGGGGAYFCVLRGTNLMDSLLPDASPAYRHLDVNILHNLILEGTLGIDKENMASQKNLTYTRDMAEAMAAVDAGNADFAFLINPTRVDEIAAVAAAGEKMPQKSTYFYPKLITGHLMNLLFFWKKEK